jgi:hypothetical protein
MLDTAILNTYLIGRQLYKDDCIQHKEFRAHLWSSLFSYSVYVSSEQKLAKFYISTTIPVLYVLNTESSINVEPLYSIKEQAEILEYKWKMLGEQVYCYNCKAIYSTSRKRKFGNKISINSIRTKRPGQTL